MLVETKFDPVRDIQETVPSLAVDINLAIETSTIPSTGTSVEYNDFDDFDSFGGRASDPFEVIEAQKNVLNRGKIVQASPRPEPSSLASSEASDGSSQS